MKFQNKYLYSFAIDYNENIIILSHYYISLHALTTRFIHATPAFALSSAQNTVALTETLHQAEYSSLDFMCAAINFNFYLLNKYIFI